jgi:hypothetical protein
MRRLVLGLLLVELLVLAMLVEVRYRGFYPRHSAYATSQAIDACIEGGGNTFFVETDAGVAALRGVPPREAAR